MLPQEDERSWTYDGAITRWRRCGRVIINTEYGVRLAAFPVSFLEKCGDNTWSYILYVLGLLVEPVDGCPGVVLDHDGASVIGDQRPESGIYTYKQLNNAHAPVPSRGPEYFSRHKAPLLNEPESTRSGSSRSSKDQDAFKSRLIARDNACLLSGRTAEKCIAAHIVPQSRPDIYDEITGDPYAFRFLASSGLLLDPALHKSFDTLDWSLYFKDDTFYVHYFVPKEPSDFPLHGVAIPRTRFSPYAGEPEPDPDLVAWHYSQAVKARIRCYSYGMQPSPTA